MDIINSVKRLIETIKETTDKVVQLIPSEAKVIIGHAVSAAFIAAVYSFAESAASGISIQLATKAAIAGAVFAAYKIIKQYFEPKTTAAKRKPSNWTDNLI